MIKNLLLAGSGGFLGASLRYTFNIFVFYLFKSTYLPIGTLLINVIGCACIGYLSGLIELKAAFSVELRIFLVVGILGGFTTYSAFGLETFNLIKTDHLLLAGMNILLQVSLGLIAVYLGFKLATYS